MWQFNPNDYEASAFSIIPQGDHRVRIEDVVFKKSKVGNDMFEITLSVSGHSGMVWHYLTLDANDPKKTNQKIGTFFESFGITDYNMVNYPRWKGKVGGARIIHEEYEGNQRAKVRFLLSRKNQEKLPPAKFGSTVSAAPAATNYATIDDEDEGLPFA
jgi:hypothetical protein